MVSTILVMVSILVGHNKIHVSYDYEGTMEDCMNAMEVRMAYDIVRDDPSILNKYFCVNIEEAQNKDPEA